MHVYIYVCMYIYVYILYSYIVGSIEFKSPKIHLTIHISIHDWLPMFTNKAILSL